MRRVSVGLDRRDKWIEGAAKPVMDEEVLALFEPLPHPEGPGTFFVLVSRPHDGAGPLFLNQHPVRTASRSPCECRHRAHRGEYMGSVDVAPTFMKPSSSSAID